MLFFISVRQGDGKQMARRFRSPIAPLYPACQSKTSRIIFQLISLIRPRDDSDVGYQRFCRGRVSRHDCRVDYNAEKPDILPVP